MTALHQLRAFLPEPQLVASGLSTPWPSVPSHHSASSPATEHLCTPHAGESVRPYASFGSLDVGGNWQSEVQQLQPAQQQEQQRSVWCSEQGGGAGGGGGGGGDGGSLIYTSSTFQRDDGSVALYPPPHPISTTHDTAADGSWMEDASQRFGAPLTMVDEERNANGQSSRMLIYMDESSQA